MAAPPSTFHAWFARFAGVQFDLLLPIHDLVLGRTSVWPIMSTGVRRWPTVSVMALVLTSACGRVGYQTVVGLDAQAFPDSGLDAQVPSDAGLDARAPIDAARNDAGLDGGCDASSTCTGGVQSLCGVDIACPLGCGGDACRLDTVAMAGKITCNPDVGLYCTVPGNSCYLTYDPTGPNVATCAASGMMPAMSLSHIDCDGPGDCPAGQECCHADYSLCPYVCVPVGQCNLSGPVQCGGSAVGPAIVLCDPSVTGICPAGQTCQRIAMPPPSPTATPIYTYGCIGP